MFRSIKGWTLVCFEASRVGPFQLQGGKLNFLILIFGKRKRGLLGGGGEISRIAEISAFSRIPEDGRVLFSCCASCRNLWRRYVLSILMRSGGSRAQMPWNQGLNHLQTLTSRKCPFSNRGRANREVQTVNCMRGWQKGGCREGCSEGPEKGA